MTVALKSCRHRTLEEVFREVCLERSRRWKYRLRLRERLLHVLAGDSKCSRCHRWYAGARCPACVGIVVFEFDSLFSRDVQ